MNSNIKLIKDLPENTTERDQISQLVEAINALPEGNGRFVLFKTLEGYSSKEIADMMLERQGIIMAPANIDTIRSRTARRLRESIAPAKRAPVAYEEWDSLNGDSDYSFNVSPSKPLAKEIKPKEKKRRISIFKWDKKLASWGGDLYDLIDDEESTGKSKVKDTTSKFEFTIMATLRPLLNGVFG